MTVKKNTKILGVIFPFNGNIIESEVGMIRFLILLRENDLNSLLRYIRTEGMSRPQLKIFLSSEYRTHS